MKKVIIESPFAGDFTTNKKYLALVIKDSLGRGEAPWASHGFYTNYLDDMIPEERKLGMEAGFAWTPVSDLVAVYTDLGISGGMKAGIENAERLGVPIVYRTIEFSG